MSAESDLKYAAAREKLAQLGHTVTGRISTYATLRHLGYRYNVITKSWDTKQLALPGFEPEPNS